jgi:hypothetical protein
MACILVILTGFVVTYVIDHVTFVSLEFSLLFIAPPGVFQGSVLGPVLFSIYNNKLCSKIKHSSCFIIFAKI